MLSAFLYSVAGAMFALTSDCMPSDQVIAVYRALDIEPSIELSLTDYGLVEWRSIVAKGAEEKAGPPLFSTLVIAGELHCYLKPLNLKEEKK